MALQRTAEPQAEPVVLADAKSFLRVDDTADDALITSLITAARMQCEDRLRRTLITSEWTLKLDCFGALSELPMAPAQSVTSISYIGTDGNAATLDASAYTLDKDSEPARIAPVSDWPDTADQFNAVTVIYKAGYGDTAADVPQPIRQWILLAVGDLYANRERSSDAQSLPMQFADALIDPYRIWP